MDLDEVSENEGEQDEQKPLRIMKIEAVKNHEVAGTLVDEPEDQISVAKYEALILNDKVHRMIMEVLDENKIPFKLGKSLNFNLKTNLCRFSLITFINFSKWFLL